MTPTLRIRSVENDADLRCVAALADIIWREHYAGLIDDAQIEYMLERGYAPARLAADVEQQGVRYWLASLNRAAVGFAAAGPDESDPGFWLHKLYVHRDARRQGAARGLLRQAESLGRTRGARNIQLRVNRGNRLAIAVYEKLGFKKNRCHVKDIGNGFVMDDYLLSKTLNDADD